MNQRQRVTWITNLAAPYRLPVWESMADDVTLRVMLLEASQRLARDHGSNRGADWVPSSGTVAIQELSTVRVSRGEARYYFAVDPLKLASLVREDAVVLGGWESPAYWQALALARASGVATVGFYESTLATQGFSEGPVAAARARFFRSLDRIVVPGPAARDAVLAMGVEPASVVVGFNAVDVRGFGRARTAPDAAGGHRFVYVGQLIERKRVDALLRAFAAAAGGEDTLRIIGRGELGSTLHQLAHQLGIDDRVTWSDYVPNAEMPDELALADTLVLPSDEEVWGLVVNEALAAGLQVVVTRNCGVVPSVAGMRGVHVVDSSDSLEGGLRAAVESYQGRIHDPEILAHTPESFAETFLAAISEATALHAGKGLRSRAAGGIRGAQALLASASRRDQSAGPHKNQRSGDNHD